MCCLKKKQRQKLISKIAKNLLNTGWSKKPKPVEWEFPFNCFCFFGPPGTSKVEAQMGQLEAQTGQLKGNMGQLKGPDQL